MTKQEIEKAYQELASETLMEIERLIYKKAGKTQEWQKELKAIEEKEKAETIKPEKNDK